MAVTRVEYRRSPWLLSYWADEGIVFHNYATGTRVAGNALTIGLLDHFSTWKSAEALVSSSQLSERDIRDAIEQLCAASLLHRSDRPISKAEAAMEQWRAWNPAAGFFHFSTKDVPFEDGTQASNDWLVERASKRPVPSPLKESRRQREYRLPRRRRSRPVERALLERRTWRRFGNGSIPLPRLSELLHITFGVQHWIDLGLAGLAMLRTSPSAGARNPLEAYVAARSITGVESGIYHYAPARHSLVRVRRGVRDFDSYLPGQSWYADAAAVVFITAVFERTEWKYPFARAYRTVLLEAGHFAQTFCVSASAAGLAPFCTAALADSLIEQDLQIDGVTESVVYACGVGTRPRGVAWAPSPDLADIPKRISPKTGK